MYCIEMCVAVGRMFLALYALEMAILSDQSFSMRTFDLCLYLVLTSISGYTIIKITVLLVYSVTVYE